MSVVICGFWCLGPGQRRRPDPQKPSFFNYYPSAIGLADSGGIPCEIRVYSPYSDVPLPESTIVFLYGRIALPPHTSPLIDAISLAPAPGDPTDPNYMDNQIGFREPIFFVCGTVSRTIDNMANGDRAFIVNTSEYVRTDAYAFQLVAIFLHDKSRWRKTRLPRIGTTVVFSGTGLSFEPRAGLVSIDVGTLLTNVGVSASTGSTTSAPSGGAPPTRFAMPSTFRAPTMQSPSIPLPSTQSPSIQPSLNLLPTPPAPSSTSELIPFAPVQSSPYIASAPTEPSLFVTNAGPSGNSPYQTQLSSHTVSSSSHVPRNISTATTSVPSAQERSTLPLSQPTPSTSSSSTLMSIGGPLIQAPSPSMPAPVVNRVVPPVVLTCSPPPDDDDASRHVMDTDASCSARDKGKGRASSPIDTNRQDEAVEDNTISDGDISDMESTEPSQDVISSANVHDLEADDDSGSHSKKRQKRKR